MRILFADSTFAYTVSTPYAEPLGGSQAAVCYLAEALAGSGHEVALITRTSQSGRDRGVVCTGWGRATGERIRAWRPDVIVAVMNAGQARRLRDAAGAGARLVYWTQHAPDQPAVQGLKDAETRAALDSIAFVSRWQQQEFLRAFGLDPSQTQVMPNAVSPAFENLFRPGERIGAAKPRPAVLAYTSTPFRGLKGLLSLFPGVRKRVPGIRLKVYSSMRVYQKSVAVDESKYGELYRRCRETDGVEYVGSLSQPALARELRSVTVLAYPNTFAETYCIAAAEAMAAGCRIVTTELGALPETTAGFGRLIPLRRETYAEEYTSALVEVIEASARGTDEDLLRRQVQHINTQCTWRTRAAAWTEWLASLCAVTALLMLFVAPALAAPLSLSFPVACDLGKTCFIQNYFDHDPGPSAKDYHCGVLTYNQHDGTDIRLVNLAAMKSGVAVVAAADGTVRAIRDGMEDVNFRQIGADAVKGREAGNSVRVEHGNGWETQYSHLRKGSVLVRPGEAVRRGQTLGFIGLSGWTEFPHVHFTVRYNGRTVDPFVGTGAHDRCGLGAAPLWDPPLLAALGYASTGLLGAGFAGARPALEQMKTSQPAAPEAASDALVFWVHGFGVQKGDTEHIRIYAPDGTVFTDRRRELDANKAEALSYIGRPRRGEAWPAGTYRGEYRLLRARGGGLEEVLVVVRSLTLESRR